MNAKVISIYAADTSGVCSALYELGGMTVVMTLQAVTPPTPPMTSHAGMTAKA